ncbi:MAG TPA: SpoIID/LytB domain-containing protein, partial [Stenomitos sp.]
MTKSTVTKFIRFGVWFLPIPLIAIPIWATLWRPSQSNLATPPASPIATPTPSPTVSLFPLLRVTPKPSPKAALPLGSSAPLPSNTVSTAGSASMQQTPDVSAQIAAHPAAQPRALASPTLSKAELARRRQLALASLAPNADSPVEMHVLIANGTSVLNVGVSNGGKVLDQRGRTLQTLQNSQTAQVNAEGNGLRFNSQLVPNILWVVPQHNSIVYVGDRGYRGTLLLVGNGAQIWAVNYVNLRQYLYSVVGAEVSPSWPMAALKAQAIAARSYALTYYFKPANKLYHLGSDEYYQVYKGLESEAESTRVAVDQTAGSFVSHRGGIVESLYA